MRNRMKRIIAIVLALLLVLGMLPGAALADPPAGACSGKDAADRNNGQHSWDAVGKQAASCTEEEGIIWKCVYCGQQYFEKTGDALGHDWTAWWTEKEAACEAAGSQRRVCNRCEREETETIPALGHDWGAWEITDPQTCEEEGQRQRRCSRCGTYDVQELPPTGHKWDSGVVTKPASYTEEGVKTYTCQNDPSHTRTERIPKLDPTPTPAPTATPTPKPTPTQAPTTPPHVHTWGEWKTDTSVPASCVQREKQYHTCKECGDIEFRVAGYGDHDWGEWEVVTPATATEAGLERRACRNDPSHTEEREIPPTGEVSVEIKGSLDLDLHLQNEDDYGVDIEINDPVYIEITVENWTNATINSLNYYDADTHELIGTQAGPLAHGESISYSFIRNAYNNNSGWYLVHVYAVGFTEEQTETAAYDDAAASETSVKSNTDDVTVPFSLYLTLDSWLDPAYAQESYNVGDPVYVVHRATNTGKITLYNLMIFHTADWREYSSEYPGPLQPGESFEVTVCRTAVDNNEGSFLYRGEARAFSRPEAHRASAATNIISQGPEIVVPLGNRDKQKAELILTDRGDFANKDVYDLGDHEFVYCDITNAGDRDLVARCHLESSFGKAVWDYPLAAGESQTHGIGPGTIKPEHIAPGTETEDLLGTVDETFWYVGIDPETGEELCSTQKITRSWKVRKPGPDEWEIPEESRLEVTQRETSASADPNGYQVGEGWNVDQFITNNGSVPVDITVSYDDGDYSWEWKWEGLQPGEEKQLHNWIDGIMTEEDAERGYVHILPVKVTWTDPDSEKEHTILSNDVVLWTINKDGPALRADKKVASRPANGQYFTVGETIEWSLTITNTGTETMTNIHVWDEVAGSAEIDVEDLAPGQSAEVSLPSSFVDEDVANILDSLANMAVVIAADEKGNRHEYAGFAWAPLSPKGAKEHPLDGEKGDTTGTADPGQPETPDHAGTPGGGEDPLGLAWGIHAGATIYKTTAGAPMNGEYYDLGEEIRYSIIVKNIGEVTLDNLSVYDSLAGFAPIGSAAGMEPGAEQSFAFVHTVTQADIDRGYVVNRAMMRYNYSGINGLPAQSNPVYSIAGENGFIPPEAISGTGSFDPSKLPGGGKPAIGPDGEPILGPDGKPVIIPDGMEIVTGPDGKPILGPDGKPVFVPIGTEPVLGPDGKPIIGPDGLPVYAPKGTEPLTGPDGSPVTVPTDLTVTGTDGTSVVIPAGTPVLKLPGGGYGVLLPDGSIIATDKNGNPILDENGNLIYIGLPGLHGLDGLDTCCELRLNSVGSAELNYTLHACPDHLEAAQAAEAAAAAGTAEGWKQAAEIWREEISEIYQLLSDAGDEPAKAAVLYDMSMFDAYLANYEVLNRVADEVTVQKAIAEMLRLRCTELCCAIHTTPERLPDSLLNGYMLADDNGGNPGREIGVLDGSDAALTERFTAPGARTLGAVVELMGGLNTADARVNAFVMAQAAWQTSLDRVVNTGYKAADKEGRKAIAGSRKALDLMIDAHRSMLQMLYAEAPDVAEEAAASLYRNALLDAGMAFGVK